MQRSRSGHRPGGPFAAALARVGPGSGSITALTDLAESNSWLVLAKTGGGTCPTREMYLKE